MAARSLFVAAAAAVLATAAAQDGPNKIGKWDVIETNSGVVGIHMALLPDDKLLLTERVHVLPEDQYNPEIMARLRATNFYGPNKNMADFLTDTVEYDIPGKKYTLKDYIPKTEEVGKNEGHAFCNGAAQMADGNVLVAGGDQFWWRLFQGRNVTSDGRRDVRIYTPGGNFVKVAELFSEGGPNGNKTFSGRWYPTAVTLPDENVMIIGGHRVYYAPAEPLANNPTYEIYDTKTKAMRAPVQVPMLVETFPINMYPITYVLPQSGKVFSLAGTKSITIDQATGAQVNGAALPNDGILPRSFPFAATNFMTPLSSKNNYKSTIWVCGGVNSTSGTRDGNTPWANCPTCRATSRCYHIDPETPGAQWEAEDMLIPRSQGLSVNLPDGTIAIVGGSGRGHQGGNAGTPYNFEPVKKVVFYNPSKPAGQRWTEGAEATVPRQYHGTALLRTDGTIVTGGDDEANFDDNTGINPEKDPYEMRLEVYSPPYMFMSDRPTLALDGVPKQLHYNQLFVVPFTKDVAQKISKVSMIRYSTVTHTLNVDQRHVELDIVKYGKNKLLVRSPPDANVAVPGNWMVWAVDNRGAPVEKAATVNLRESNPGDDAAWNEKDTVQPDAATVSAQQGQNAGSGAVVGARQTMIGWAVVVVGALATALW